ncbi:uncharacterized protein GIQ15_03260 [Arthroderma uncinatum]|uniref:uncharacterized protein n=1 Tax=Arthroderma uncinatum TaxID=74035 RepID=UPI00144AE28C|nr:uncharacterized protein GIQ15_03260 [Arthroderma uncinatum]KAF3483936.1 hypothetical protein GIQ15_03260 [Arthroderma uncinatum]
MAGNGTMLRDLFYLLIHSDAPFLMVLMSLSVAMAEASRVPMLEAAVCREWYLTRSPQLVSPEGHVSERLCKLPDIQTKTMMLIGGDMRWAATTALMMAFPSAWLARRVDKRKLLILCTTGFSAKTATFTLLCRYLTGSLRAIWLIHCWDMIGASQIVILTLLWSMVAERTTSAIRDGEMGEAEIQNIAEDVNTPLLQPVANSGDSDISSLGSEVKGGASEECIPQFHGRFERLFGPVFWATTNYLSRIHFHILRHRVFQAGFALEFFTVLAMGTNMVLPQWTSHQFDWPLARVTTITAFTMLVSIAALITGPFINARLLPYFRTARHMDLFVTRSYIIIRSVGAVMLGFCRTPATFFPALVLYTMGVGLVDSTKALVTHFSDPTYITELYTTQAIVNNMGAFTGGCLWPAVFNLQLKLDGFWSGLPFWISGGLFLVALLVTGPFQSQLRKQSHATFGV